ncbi:MFS family permease [Anaerosolibacter carboniphilus]|uniref:MFS family permease n=1 Tax=Anaerosolibacter carboniphilus TaxID=1417629 RepID=A0A841KQV9_9FIRM|nr:OFA family MFS transporter [Anaerosolibacter carboniphilus]MBB6214480.1 MFS family permease [Anaerosolibacter carboniphilus]
MNQGLSKSNPIKHPQRWMFVFGGIIIMMCLGTVYSWSTFRLHIEKIFNAGATLSGLPYMTSLAFYAFFMFLIGKYLDRYTPRQVISAGAFLVALGWILSAYAPNIYILTITYGVIIGTGVGIAYGVPMTVVARWFPEKKGLAVGLVLIGFGLSPLITAPLAGNLIEAYGVMKTFLILGISFGIIIPIASCPLKYPTDADNKYLETASTGKEDIHDMDTAKMVKSAGFKALYFNFLIGAMIGLMLVGMTSNVGVEFMKIPQKTVALFIPLFAVFNGIGRPIFGWLTDKISSKKAMLISYGLIIIGAVLILTANKGNLFLFSISFSIFWFNLGGWLAIAPNSTMIMFGTKHYSQNYGVVFTAYGVGAIIGVLASGMLMDVLQDYRIIFYFVITLCSVGILLSRKIIKADSTEGRSL